MKKLISTVFAIGLAIAPMASNAGLFDKKGPEDQKSELREARSAALDKLYEEKPHAREEVQSAVGYAVFSSVGVNLFVVATERGGGILHDNQSGDDTYMKMFSAGGGMGMGVKDFDAIFIFHTETAMQKFTTEGWDFTGKADMSAESGDKGMGEEAALTVVPGTTIYQLTEAGLALQATLQGTKFWIDEDLN